MRSLLLAVALGAVVVVALAEPGETGDVGMGGPRHPRGGFFPPPRTIIPFPIRTDDVVMVPEPVVVTPRTPEPAPSVPAEPAPQPKVLLPPSPSPAPRAGTRTVIIQRGSAIEVQSFDDPGR